MWYDRLNRSTAALSVVILIAVVVLQLFGESLGLEQSLGLSLAVGAIALVHAVFAVVGFMRLSQRSAQLAALISFVLFALMSGWLVISNLGSGLEYFALWTLVIFLSGLFGWLVLGITTVAFVGLFILSKLGVIGLGGEINELTLVINLAVGFVSGLLWWQVGKDLNSISKKAAAAIPLSARINTDVLIDSIVDGLMVVDDNDLIQTYNPAAQELSGWTAKEAKNLDYRSVFKLVDAKGAEIDPDDGPIARCLAMGQAVDENSTWLVNKDGKKIELEISASPVKDSKQQTIAAMVVFRDVSKKRSEERQRAEFISTASHEMRTPVAAIEGYLALAMNDKVSKIDSKARSYLEKAHSSTQHLGKLFQDLLTAAKSEDGRLTNNPRVVEVGKFLAELVENVRFTAEKKGLQLDYQTAGLDITTASDSGEKSIQPIYYIHVDPDRLREVIINLFDNAIKYTEEGKITIGLNSEKDNVLISVADTGPGIGKDDIPHLFQKFYRVDNTATRQIGGTGLGLFISKKIIELYNGRIWAESVLGEGATFKLSLPQISAQKAQDLLKEEAANESPLSQAVNPNLLAQTQNDQETLKQKPDASAEESKQLVGQ